MMFRLRDDENPEFVTIIQANSVAEALDILAVNAGYENWAATGEDPPHLDSICVACSGSGKSSRGGVCVPCKGSGFPSFGPLDKQNALNRVRSLARRFNREFALNHETPITEVLLDRAIEEAQRRGCSESDLEEAMELL